MNVMAGIGVAFFDFEIEADVENDRLRREKEHGFPIPIANRSLLDSLCLDYYERKTFILLEFIRISLPKWTAARTKDSHVKKFATTKHGPPSPCL